MSTFTKAARLAGLKKRKENAALRRAGKLPPIKRAGELSLDHPVFGQDPGFTKKVAVKGPKLKGDNRAIVLRLLTLIERLV